MNIGKILAVDDTPDSLKLLTDILKAEGYEVRSAISGDLALRSAISNPPELVLLDVRMPEMDGFEVCRRLRAQPSTRDVPVIFVSALSETDEKVQGFEVGAVDFVTKPFQRDELLARVRTHLELNRLRDHLEDLVAERTAELVESGNTIHQLNQSLERRIQEEVAKNREKDLMLIQQSRLATMGEMMHNVAHQWRQPLNTVGLILQNIKADYEEGFLNKETLGDLVSDGFKVVQRMSATIDDFRNFFRPNHEKSRFSLEAEVRVSLNLIMASLNQNRIFVTIEAPEDVYVEGYPNEYAQVLLNVLTNAKDAIKDKGNAGTIVIRIEDGNGVGVVRIRNNGGTIPENVLAKVFDPYFTTKESGSGIGLYMSCMIMEHMNGHIEVQNLDDGVEVVISVPKMRE